MQAAHESGSLPASYRWPGPGTVEEASRFVEAFVLKRNGKSKVIIKVNDSISLIIWNVCGIDGFLLYINYVYL